MLVGPFLYLWSRRRNPRRAPRPATRGPVRERDARGIGRVNTVAAPRIPILLYHSVCDNPAPLMRDWSVTPARFAAHLSSIADAGYETLTVSDHVERLQSGASLPERVVLITFDDGFADFATHAAPALREHGFASTLYVSTAYVGATSSWLGPEGEQPMLSWDAIRDLPESGVEIGAHAHHHWELDALDPDVASREILMSKALLEDALGRPVSSFAYPHGYHTRTLQAVLRGAGFTSACGVKHAMSSPTDDVFGLARIIVPPESTGTELLALMTGLEPAPTREQLRTKAWRAVRRARAQRAPAVGTSTAP